MKLHVGGRLFLAAAVLGAVAVLALGLFLALTVRSTVAGPNADPLKPNPGHEWSEIGDFPEDIILPGNVGVSTHDDLTATLTVKGDGEFYCPDQSVANHQDSYIRLAPSWWPQCNAVTIDLNEYRANNRLLISAYDAEGGNFIYSEDPPGGTSPGPSQGFGIAGGNGMAPLERFVVNSDETFLGYSIYPGNGAQCYGGNAAGNLYVRGQVGIGTTSPGNYKLNVQGGTGNAVYGETSGAPGTTAAVYGYNAGNGDAVRGDCTFIGCKGVRGENTASGVGVYGKAGINGAGVEGETSGPAGKAVAGRNTAGFGGYFEGKGYFSDAVGIGTTDPQSALQVNGYVQLALTGSPPPPADCSLAAHFGRMKFDPMTHLLWICGVVLTIPTWISK